MYFQDILGYNITISIQNTIDIQFFSPIQFNKIFDKKMLNKIQFKKLFNSKNSQKFNLKKSRIFNSKCGNWQDSIQQYIRVILILQKFDILKFACCQIVPICSLISELFLFLFWDLSFSCGYFFNGDLNGKMAKNHFSRSD